MNHFGTYLRTHVQVIFQGRHPTLKLLLKKSPKLYKSMFQKKIYLAKIQKKTKIRPKKPGFFYQKLQFIVFFFKIFKSTLLKISLLFPNSSPRGLNFFFLQKIVLNPFFSPDIFLRGGQTPNRRVGQQLGRTRSARDFCPPPRGLLRGGQYRFRVGK